MREPKKIKTDFSARLIVALVFGLIGIIYVPLGIGLHSLDTVGRIFFWVFGGLGTVMLTISLILLVTWWKKRRQIQAAYDEGECILCTVSNIYADTSVRINGRCLYRAECEYTDPSTGDIHVYRSTGVKYIPQELVGNTVRVYVDRYTNAYYVDLEEILPTVILH